MKEMEYECPYRRIREAEDPVEGGGFVRSLSTGCWPRHLLKSTTSSRGMKSDAVRPKIAIRQK